MSKFIGKLITGSALYPSVSIASSGTVWTPKDQVQAKYSGNWPNNIIPVMNYLLVGGGGYGGAGTSYGGTPGGGGGGGLQLGTFTMLTNISATVGLQIGNGGFGGSSQGQKLGGGAAGSGAYYGGWSPGSTVLSFSTYAPIGSKVAYAGGNGGVNGGGGSGGSGGGAGSDNSGSGNGIGAGGNYNGPGSIYGGYGGYGGGGSSSSQGAGGGAGGAAVGNTPGPGLYVNIADGSSYSGTFAAGGVGGSAVSTYGSNTGNGAGGGWGTYYGGEGTWSADGVAIFWWPAIYNHPFTITGNYTTSIENGYRIYKFTPNFAAVGSASMFF